MTARTVSLAAALLLAAAAVPAQQESKPWPREFYDPAPDGAPADLILPLPCGAAMAFQKVTVPVAAADPLDDRRLRLGQSREATGYADYLRPAFLRGSFTDRDGDSSFYYISRFELTRGQYRALRGDCAPPTRSDRLAQGGLSWFDAVEAARLLTGWLTVHARDSLPDEDGVPGFLRLPTETEWEYAARGGARVDAARFGDLTFFGDGDMNDYALHQASGSARGRLGPVGLRQPNPLGLYDVYGNAEELVLEPFRLNAIGREHGQAGGVVTRGGSVLSTADQLYSAQRTEYPPYDPATGAATAADTFGVRFVLATPVITSDGRLADIRDRWQARADAEARPDPSGEDPLALLSDLVAAEIDPRRRAALNDLRLEVRRTRDRMQTALQQSASSTLLAGAVFVETLNETAAAIEAKRSIIRLLVEQPGRKSDMFNRQVLAHVREIEELRRLQSTYLLSFRAALDTLWTDVPPDIRASAHAVLREELKLSGQGRTLQMLDQFWDDLGRYGAQPDLAAPDLLQLALDGG